MAKKPATTIKGSATPLGELVRVDLREAWLNEAQGFTPWLAEPENLARLGKALGLQLEVQGVEQNVGPFRADILCKEVGTEGFVLIENQLKDTDHNHLGQILTYAAGLEATKVVWIAARFTAEHRAAVDWLNRNTAEGFSFFGIEVELWKIGNSKPAPRFHLVARPNDWSQQVKRGKSTSGSDLAQRAASYRELWTTLSNSLAQQEAPFDLKPTGLHWVYLGVGVPDFKLVASYSFANRVAKLWAIFAGDAIWETFAETRKLAQKDRTGALAAVEWSESEDQSSGYGLATCELPASPAARDEKLAEWVLKIGGAIQAVARTATARVQPQASSE